MAIDFNHMAAFAPLRDKTAIFIGKRRETGASSARDLRLAVPCDFIGGGQADANSGALAQSSARSYTVMVRIGDWPDHHPPSSGDSVEIGELSLRVVSWSMLDGDYFIRCMSTD